MIIIDCTKAYIWRIVELTDYNFLLTFITILGICGGFAKAVTLIWDAIVWLIIFLDDICAKLFDKNEEDTTNV